MAKSKQAKAKAVQRPLPIETKGKSNLKQITIRVPNDLLIMIDERIHFSGYRSRNEFFVESATDKINRIAKGLEGGSG